jgi:TolB-like protein/DNA-binding winged helix-turn-helix (wHTH) protein/Tfp pilus assembly protein PilF
MLQQTKHYFEFGPYRLDPAAGVLTRDGALVVLNPKAVDTLAVLIRHHGNVVSKEELMKAVWPHAFVEEANLNVQISVLRKALEDSPEHPAFVETIPRRGYRFCAAVQEVYEEPAEWKIQRRSVARVVIEEQEAISATPETHAAILAAGPAPAESIRRRLTGRAMALSALFVLLAALAINFWPRPGQPVSGAPSGRFLIGVLPFANLSGDPGQEYLADGLTEELITELARLNPRQMGVIARASMMPYKRAAKGLREVAQELGLRYALEGSVVRAGQRLRVTVKLLQAGDQSQLWANQYERDFSDLMEVQRDIARDVARQTFVHVSPEYQKRLEQARAVSPQAYDAYLKGRVYWWMRTVEGYERARAYFEEALRLDPGFARAQAGLADISIVYAMRLGDPRILARKALALDDSLAEVHASMGMALASMESNWTAAETHFRRALEIDPYYAPARHWYGFVLMHAGRHAEAIEQIERAREIDPLNIVILSDLGRALFFARQYERSKEPLLKAVSIDANFPWPHYWLGRIYEHQGNFQQALFAYQRADHAGFSRMNKDAALAALYARMGHPEKTREMLRRLENTPDFFYVNRAQVYVALGELNRAIEILLKSSSRFDTYVIHDPGFDPLRSDPRFQAFVARIAPPAR